MTLTRALLGVILIGHAVQSQSALSEMKGSMFQFSSRDKNLLGFMTLNSQLNPCRNALVFIAGQYDGFLSLKFAPTLSEKLLSVDYSLIQVNLASSFIQFGFNSLQTDVEDLTDLVTHIEDNYDFEKIVFMGSSTGSQDALFFLRHSNMANKISAVILQGAVSDRDFIVLLPGTPDNLKEARELQQAGQAETILNRRYYGAPITASRFLSLATRLGDDDMFSLDLTEEELTPILSPVRVPVALCFSAQDEYVPDLVGQRVFAERMVRVLKKTSPRVESLYFNGDHALNKAEDYRPFVEYVTKFVSRL